MFDPEFLELMPFTATLKPSTGKNRYGEDTFGTALSPAPKCHIQYTGKQVYGKDKMVRTEDGVCHLDGVYGQIDTNWYLAIPAPQGTRVVNIISVAHSSDEQGWHHTKISFGAF